MNRSVIEFLGSGGRIIEETDHTYQISLFNGTQLWCPKSDESLTPCLTRDFYWESWITSWFLDELARVDTFVDIGANCGYYSALARNEGVKSYAFEPNPSYTALLDNIEGLAVVPMGVSNRAGTATLYIPGSLEGSASMCGGFPDHEVKEVSVECTTLDDYFANEQLGNILIKVDAEGMEENILNGGQNFSHATWMLEYTPQAYSNDFLDSLARRYKITTIDYEGKEQPISKQQIEQATDWIMLVLRSHGV